jgi:hypothetical protein
MKKLSEVIKLLFHQSIKGLLLRKSFSTLFDGFLKLEKTGAIGHGNRAGKREKKKKNLGKRRRKGRINGCSDTNCKGKSVLQEF